MRRERLLPGEKPLEKVGRYEAHLSRLLYKSLHELEALQPVDRAKRLPWSAPTRTACRESKLKRVKLPNELLPAAPQSPVPCAEPGTSCSPAGPGM